MGRQHHRALQREPARLRTVNSPAAPPQRRPTPATGEPLNTPMAPAHRDPHHNHAIITDLEERVTDLEERLENATTASTVTALEERLAAIEEQLSSNR